jgi:hypothetical protein
VLNTVIRRVTNLQCTAHFHSKTIIFGENKDSTCHCVSEMSDAMRQVQAKLRDMSTKSEGFLSTTCGDLDKDNAKELPPPPP